jgi:hypothetical protein
MAVRGSGFHLRRSPGGPAGNSFSVPGVSTGTNLTTISVPSGAAAGDMLLLYISSGLSNSTTAPSGFTQLFLDTGGGIRYGIHYRVMQAGDTSWTLSGVYATLVALHSTGGTPVADGAANTQQTTGGTWSSPSLTPTTGSDAALMSFLSSDGANRAPAPGYTALITYNLSGPGGSGMSISFTQLASSSAFAGTTCGAVASTGFLGSAAMLLFK